jgi:hypothetical protein
MALGFVLTVMIRLAVTYGSGIDTDSALHASDTAAAQAFAEQGGTREWGSDRPPTIGAPDSADPLFTRVRSTERYMIELIREGYDRSATFRQLVDALQRSNVIVFVQPGYCARGRIRSCLVSVGGSLMERHIRIKVDPQHTTQFGLIATVAHELQHAVEIAEQPEVVDASGALKLYRQIALGQCRSGLSEECETKRALATERKVTEELFRYPANAQRMSREERKAHEKPDKVW